MSDLILKEIYNIYETKNLTNKQTQKYKMTEREILEKYHNLSRDELNTKIIKMFMSRMMPWVLLFNVAEVKKKRRNKNRWI